MIQFYDLDDAPPDVRQQAGRLPVPLAERPLVCPLPAPPVCYIGGVEYTVERVAIRDLEAWKRRHGLRLVRGADLGQHGPVAVYEYVREGEEDDPTAV